MVDKPDRVQLVGGHGERIGRTQAEEREREREQTEKPRNSEPLQHRTAEVKNTELDQFANDLTAYSPAKERLRQNTDTTDSSSADRHGHNTHPLPLMVSKNSPLPTFTSGAHARSLCPRAAPQCQAHLPPCPAERVCPQAAVPVRLLPPSSAAHVALMPPRHFPKRNQAQTCGVK